MNRLKKEVTGFRLVFGYLGIFFVFLSLLNALPLIFLAFFPEEWRAAIPFSISAGSCLVLGLILYFGFIFKRPKARFQRFEESLLLILIWVMAVISGALPFFIANLMGNMSMGFSESIFESASAYSTTGLTIFKDYLDTNVLGASAPLGEGVSFCPHIFTYHRAQMQFVGGVGLVLLVASVLGGQGGTSLYVTEGHSDKLLPHLGKSAKLIFGIYLLYTVIGVIALVFSGMPWFEAICTSMSSLSGGGFSPRSENIYAYRAFEGTVMPGSFVPVHPLAIEAIVSILVILSCISFVLHTFLLRGRFKQFFKDDEIRYASAMIGTFMIVAFFGACTNINIELADNPFFHNAGYIARDTAFYMIQAATNAGFTNTPLTRYLELGKPLLYLCTILMIVGGGAGSCAGGIKQYRMTIAFKDLIHKLRFRFAPSRQRYPKTTYRYGERRELTSEMSKEAYNYILLFLMVFVLMVTTLCFLPEFNPENAAFLVASGMSNTGLSLTDLVQYKLSHATSHPAAIHVLLWSLSIVMILGRLEIMPILYANRCVREEFSYMHRIRMAKRHNLEKETE